MSNALSLRLDAILSLFQARADDAEFERKHPRAKDGKFGSGGGGGRGSTEISQKPKGREGSGSAEGGEKPAGGGEHKDGGDKPEPRKPTGIVGIPGGHEERFAGKDMKALKKEIYARPAFDLKELQAKKIKWKSLFNSAGDGLFSVDKLMPEGEHHKPTDDVLKIFDAAAAGEFTKRSPIVVDFVNGELKVVDGRSTLAALKALGVKEVPVISKKVADAKKVQRIAYGNWMEGNKARAMKRVPTSPPEDLEREGAKLKPEMHQKLREMYAKGSEALPDFQDSINDIASSVGGTPMVAPLKGAARAVEKVLDDADNPGDPGSLRDLVRGSVLVDSLAGAQGAINQIGKKYKIVGRVRNLFAADPKTGKAARTIDGYRDYKCNIELPNGLIGEIQVHVPEIMYAKENGEGHLLYEERRPLDGKKGKMTAAEAARYAALNKRSREAYDPAWAKARAKGKALTNSSRDSSAPLRTTSPKAKGTSEPSRRTVLQAAPPLGNRRTTTGLPSTSQRPKGKKLSSATANPPSTTPRRSIPQSGKESTSPSTAKQAGAAIAAMRGAKPAAGNPKPAETANEAAEPSPPHYTPSSDPAARALRQKAAAASERTNQRRVGASINRTTGKAGNPEFEVLNGGTRVKKTPNPREALSEAERINSALPTHDPTPPPAPYRQGNLGERVPTPKPKTSAEYRARERKRIVQGGMAAALPNETPNARQRAQMKEESRFPEEARFIRGTQRQRQHRQAPAARVGAPGVPGQSPGTAASFGRHGGTAPPTAKQRLNARRNAEDYLDEALGRYEEAQNPASHFSPHQLAASKGYEQKGKSGAPLPADRQTTFKPGTAQEARENVREAKLRLNRAQAATGVPPERRVKVDSRRRAKARADAVRNRIRRTPAQRINALLSRMGIGA